MIDAFLGVDLTVFSSIELSEIKTKAQLIFDEIQREKKRNAFIKKEHAEARERNDLIEVYDSIVSKAFDSLSTQR